MPLHNIKILKMSVIIVEGSVYLEFQVKCVGEC